MRTKLATGALVGAILMGQYEAKAQTNQPPQPEVIGIDDCIEIAALSVIILGGYSCWANGWHKFWSDHGTNDTIATSPPLEPPWGYAGGGLDSLGKPKLRMNGAYAYSLTNDLPYTNMIMFIQQATEDFVTWTNRFMFAVWESPTNRLMLVSSPEGVPLWTDSAARGIDGKSTNYCPLLGPQTKPKEFFRLLSQ